jgi:hypothetical protein
MPLDYDQMEARCDQCEFAGPIAWRDDLGR